MIISQDIKISKTDNLTNDYIETELQKMEISPLRWAIVDVSEIAYTVSVSYEKFI